MNLKWNISKTKHTNVKYFHMYFIPIYDKNRSNGTRTHNYVLKIEFTKVLLNYIIFINFLLMLTQILLVGLGLFGLGADALECWQRYEVRDQFAYKLTPNKPECLNNALIPKNATVL